jgi:hypothetical protein
VCLKVDEETNDARFVDDSDVVVVVDDDVDDDDDVVVAAVVAVTRGKQHLPLCEVATD